MLGGAMPRDMLLPETSRQHLSTLNPDILYSTQIPPERAVAFFCPDNLVTAMLAHSNMLTYTYYGQPRHDSRSVAGHFPHAQLQLV